MSNSRTLTRADLVACVFALAALLAALTSMAVKAVDAGASSNNFIDTDPSCSLSVEVIDEDPDSYRYVYDGTNPSKTMWVTTGPPDDLEVFVHTFYEAGTVVAPKSDFVQYPTSNTWISVDLLFELCSPEQPTTTTTEQPTTTTTEQPTTTTTTASTTTTSTPDQRVTFTCPEGQFVRMEFEKISGEPALPTDVVHFTYVGTDGNTRTHGTIANVDGRFMFTGSGLDGIFNVATLVSVDTEGFRFFAFTCYVPPVETTTTTEQPTTTTTEAPVTTTSVDANENFSPVAVRSAGLAGQAPTCPQIGRTNIPFGDPDYRRDLDRDNDLVACDTSGDQTFPTDLGYTGANTKRDFVIAFSILFLGGLLLFVAARTPAYKQWQQHRRGAFTGRALGD